MAKLPPIVQIFWKDACSRSEWSDPSELDLCCCMTSGFLVREDKEKFVISSTITEDNQVGDSISIPKQWVKQKKILKK